jgi:hypothetical protein
LAFGAALELEGQIDVFQLLLGRRRRDGLAQRVRELALLFNGAQHYAAALVQFAQINQAGFQGAQLHVVQTVGGFFAVAGNKGDAGAAVQQIYGGLHLLRAYLEFLRQQRNNV